MLRALKGRNPQPTAVTLDARVLQSTPDSGRRAGCSGAKRRKGSKGSTSRCRYAGLYFVAVRDPTKEVERTQVETSAAQVQTITGEHVEIAYVDFGYTGLESTARATEHALS